jgi:TetR/AcrR family transcriptional repressor of nem operon
MPRPKDFDEAAALDAAIDRFWNFGYSATSVRDLGAAMGIGPASFYNSFGDKGALFLRCLDRYLDAHMRTLIGSADAVSDPRAAITGFVDAMVSASLTDPRGCMLVNTMLEVAPHDAEVAMVTARRLSELEAFFRRHVVAGRASGAISTRYPADSLAGLLLASVLGLRVLARTQPEPALLERAAALALALLDPDG